MKDRYDETGVRSLIAQNLKRLRELKNLSQLNLSAIAGLTHNFINDIENCTKWVSAKTIAKLASALEVEPYQFFLPGSLPDDAKLVYLRDFQDSLAVFVKEYSEHYLSERETGTDRRQKPD
jgi:transcriptional regulator with XRE-family HTH domain